MQLTTRVKQPAERTRADILAAAEAVFMEKGFAAARLQDVAQRVGIRRASIVYYFRDKRELYDGVLQNLFGNLAERYETVLATGAPLPERIEAVIRTWVDYVAERPAVARILLREAADFAPAQRREVGRYTAPAMAAVARVIRDGQQAGLLNGIDPIHFIFAVVGATVFFASATPAFAPEWPYDPLSPAQLDTLRQEILAIARRLLGMEGAGHANASRPEAPPKAAERVRERNEMPQRSDGV
jgi:TetR/AcrR family transcriptional regulator